MLKFAMLLQAIDRVTGPAKRIQASMKGMGRGAEELARKTEKANAPVSRLSALSTRLGSSIATAGRAAARWSGRAGIAGLGFAAEKAGFMVGGLLRKMGEMTVGAAKWAGAAALGAGGFALFDLFRTASQFEQFEIMLENMEGSAAAAKKSFDWVKEFAQKTPYELADVMGSFVKMKAYGIDPMNGSLRAMGDAAAGMSKPLEQAVEAMADAMTGEFERLKEFGIKSKKEGDKVTFSYRKNGKDLRKDVKATSAEIEKALTAIMSDRFGGMMDRQSRTMAGMISNLKDQWSNFLMMVADAGIFDMVKARIEKILAKVQQWAKDGTLKAWAEKVSDGLEKAWKWAEELIEKTDWAKVGADLKTIADAAVILANAIKTAVEWGQKLSFLDKFNPVRMGIGGFGAAYDQVFGGSPAAPAKPAPAAAPGFFNGGSASRRAPLGPPRSLPPKKTAANDLQVGGKAVIDVRVTGPASARLASNDAQRGSLPMVVNIGRSMAGAA